MTGSTVYAATLYHDSEFNAAEDERDLGYYPSLAAATKAVNTHRDDHWQTGGVTRGTLHPAVFGKRPERFESDGDGSWFVGTDGKPDR